eukprot:TRINITY_DN459_c5_g1_i1.p1 TRINITY_DN459_c5_g1~~TRINITY_DN459_c5_g1_i1.p1  ORF type:complete len:602 (+),score=112.68 TRINITY_DN459_c5_g1_i1:91-1896(+)
MEMLRSTNIDCRSWYTQQRRKLNDLPVGVLVLYFANAFLLTFPMLAMMDWLKYTVQMPLSTQNNYYAATYIPWSLKPLYAYIAEQLPMVSRRQWVGICAVGSSLVFLGMAIFPKAHDLEYDIPTNTVTLVPFEELSRTAPPNTYSNGSNAAITMAFILGFLNNVFLTFYELMAGVMLVEHAQLNMKNAGALQAAANGTRQLGSLAAAIMTLIMYPCHKSGPDTGLVSVKGFLFMTAAFSLFSVFATYFLPADDYLKKLTEDNDDGDRQLVCKRESEPSSPVEKATKLAIVQYTGALFMLELFMVVISIRHFLDYDVWFPFLMTSGCVFVAYVVFLLFDGYYNKRSINLVPKGLGSNFTIVGTAIFIFLASSTPDSSIDMGNWSLSYFSHCQRAHLSCIGFASGIIASLCYFPIGNGKDLRYVIPIATTASAFVTYIFSTPLSKVDVPAIPGHGTADTDFFGIFTCDTFTFQVVGTIVGSFVYMISFIPREVLATQNTSPDAPALSYAILISIIDVGASFREWITAPIVRHLGITYVDFSKLHTLVLISCLSNAGVSLLAPVLLWGQKIKRSRSLNDDDAGLLSDADDYEDDATKEEKGVDV